MGALQSAGVEGVGAAGKMEVYAQTLEKTTGIHDELIIKAMGLGAAIGKFTGEDLVIATQAAIGWAAILETDVNSAMLSISRAAQGNFRAFNRLSKEIKEAATDEEKYNLVLQKGQQGFLAAQLMASGLSGELKKNSNAWKDLKKDVGETSAFMAPVTRALLTAWRYGTPLGNVITMGGIRADSKELNDKMKDTLAILGQYKDTGEEAAEGIEKLDEALEKLRLHNLKTKIGEAAFGRFEFAKAGGTPEQLELYDQITEDTKAFKTATDGAMAYAEAMKRINKEIATFGMSENWKAYYDFAGAGRTKEELKAYQNKIMDIENLEAGEAKIKAIKDVLGEMADKIRSVQENWGFGLIDQLIGKGVAIEDIRQLIPLIKEVQEITKKQEPFGRAPGWAPFESQTLVGHQAPRMTTDYQAQTAKNTAKQIEVSQKIEQAIKNLAIKRGESLVLTDL
jgi:hypothetical protein